MGNDSLDELLEDTIQIMNIICRGDVNKFLLEQDVSGVEPSPNLIKMVCSFLGKGLRLQILSNLKEGGCRVLPRNVSEEFQPNGVSHHAVQGAS